MPAEPRTDGATGARANVGAAGATTETATAAPFVFARRDGRGRFGTVAGSDGARSAIGAVAGSVGTDDGAGISSTGRVSSGRGGASFSASASTSEGVSTRTGSGTACDST